MIPVSWGVTWEEAYKTAKESGGYLVTINSKAENDFIYKLISKNKDLWLLDNSGNGYGPWTGGYKKGKSWQWVTGETFKYSNWSSGEPNNYNGKEDVICFYRSGMIDKPLWNDVNRKTILPACIVEFD